MDVAVNEFINEEVLPMFVVVFEFVVRTGKEDEFKQAWRKTTQGIYLFKGSLGSRLHRDEEGRFIAYAQWPDRQSWERSGEIAMSGEYEQHRQAMHDALNLDTTRILFKLDVEADYLQSRPFAF